MSDIKFSVPIIGKFYRKDSEVEHPCCWGAAICCKTTEGNGQYGSDEMLVLECNAEDAEYILERLNRGE